MNMATNRNGQALLAAVAIMLIVMTVCLAAVVLSSNQRKTVILRAHKVQAYYNAQSGVEMVLAELSGSEKWYQELPLDQEVIFYQGKSCRVVVRKVCQLEKKQLLVESRGYCGDAKQTLEVKLDLGEQVEVVTWREKYPVLPD